MAAGSTVAAHEGAFIQRGKQVSTLLGEDRSHAVAIVQFPSGAAAQGWFDAPAYQALQEPRDSAADMQFTLFEVA